MGRGCESKAAEEPGCELLRRRDIRVANQVGDGTPSILVLTQNEAFWKLRRAEADEVRVTLVREGEAELAQLVILDARAGVLPWLNLLEVLAETVPIIVSLGPGQLEVRLQLSRRKLITVYSPHQAELVDRALIVWDRIRARPRLWLVTKSSTVQRLGLALGASPRTLTSAHQLWESLEEEIPDAVLFDATTIEAVDDLAMTLRQDTRFARCLLFALEDPVRKLRPFPFDTIVPITTEADEIAELFLARFRGSDAVRRLIDHDSLTGLVNRRRAKSRINFLIRLSLRQHTNLALALVDLDHFKQVNDTYGHAVGDRVLRRVGRLLRQSFRPEDVTARVGGEEFLVGAYGSSGASLAQRLRQCLEELRSHQFSFRGKQPFRVTFSGGVAELGLNGQDYASLFEEADKLLYLAKERGRQCVFTSDS